MPLEQPYIKQPVLNPINRKEYSLWEPYTHTWIYTNKKTGKKTTYQLTVHKYFITDGASIPRWTWSIGGLTPDGLYRPAALIHDFLYAYRGGPPGELFLKFNEETKAWEEARLPFLREECDELFLQLMLEAGVDNGTAQKMFKAVRMFGWMAW